MKRILIKIKKIYRRFFKSGDVDFLVKNSHYKLTHQITIFIFGFIIAWAFGNFTSQEFYGTYLFIMNTMGFFSFLTFTGISQSLVQSTASGYDYFYKYALKKNVIYAISGTIVITGYAVFYYNFIAPNEVILFSLLIVAISFPITAGLSLYKSFLAGKGNFRLEFIYNMISYALTVLLLFILIFLTRNLFLHFLLLKLGVIFLSIFFTVKSLEKIELDAPVLELNKKAMRYGINLSKYSIITLVCANINSIVVGMFYGPGTLASFNVGIGISLKLYHFLKPSLSVFLTRYSDRETHISRRFLLLLIIGSILLFIGVNLALPLYLQILFPNYLDSFSYGFMYSFITLVTPFVVVIGYYFRGKAEVRIVRNAMIIPDIISLLLIAPFVISLGIYGLILNDLLRLLMRLIIYGLYWKRVKII